MSLTQSELDRLLIELSENETALGAQIKELLLQTREDIVSALGSNPSQWDAFHLKDLLDKVDARIVDLRYNLLGLIGSTVHDVMGIGGRIGSSALPGNAVLGSPGINPQMLQQLTDYRADLITNVTDYTRGRITELVRRSVMGGKSLSDVQKELGGVLPGKGLFKTVEARVDTILRTEFNRIANMANFESMKASLQYVPDLKKRWLTSGQAGNVRPWHAAAHGQTVPVMMPFIVDGEKLMYPHDPNGSGRNTINCKCVAIPVVD